MKVAVIGAGPAGMTTAYQLAKHGLAVDVFEASPSIGGLAKTISLWGQKVDLGPHRFFSSDPRVNKLWREVVGTDYDMVKRLTRIYYNGRFFSYPLNPGNALLNLGLVEASLCVASYVSEQLYPTRSIDSFESWVIRRFGRRLFETFFKAYSEKLWGIACSELDSDFAAQRIRQLSLGAAVWNAVVGSRGDRHRTLLEEFAYPHGGSGMVYEQMARFVESSASHVHCNAPVVRVLTDGSHVWGVELPNGQTKRYDHVVSTMPLTLLIEGMDNVPEKIKSMARKLRFRNTLLVYLNVESPRLFPDNWLYIHSPLLLMGRVTNFRNWVPQLYGQHESTILGVEFWCFDQDAIWTEDNIRLGARAASEMRSTGLLGDATISDTYVYRIRRCYPVYEREYKETLRPIQEYLDSIGGLSAIGRYGAFKYNNQDHSILMGILTADNILQGPTHDLWAINTDYESYQEASRIADTQLQK